MRDAKDILQEYVSDMVALDEHIHEAIKRVRPDGWRGVQAREQIIKAELYKFLKDVAEVERIFVIIKAQREY